MAHPDLKATLFRVAPAYVAIVLSLTAILAGANIYLDRTDTKRQRDENTRLAREAAKEAHRSCQAQNEVRKAVRQNRDLLATMARNQLDRLTEAEARAELIAIQEMLGPVRERRCVP